MVRTLLVGLAVCLAPLPVPAREFYVDPVNGSPTGDGSASRPWRTIQEVFDAGRVESQQWDKLPYTPQSKLVVRNAGAPGFNPVPVLAIGLVLALIVGVVMAFRNRRRPVAEGTEGVAP